MKVLDLNKIDKLYFGYEDIARIRGIGTDSAKAIEELAASIKSTDGVYLVPAFVGLGAPHWNDAARGLITGLTRGTTQAHLARATLESIAYQIRDIFDVMQTEAGTPLQMLRVDGGASRNNLLMQFQSDIIDCPIRRSSSADVSALGAAYLAGLATSVWHSEAQIAELPRPHDNFEPRMANSERAELYGGWQQAIARVSFDPGI